MQDGLASDGDIALARSGADFSDGGEREVLRRAAFQNEAHQRVVVGIIDEAIQRQVGEGLKSRREWRGPRAVPDELGEVIGREDTVVIEIAKLCRGGVGESGAEDTAPAQEQE